MTTDEEINERMERSDRRAFWRTIFRETLARGASANDAAWIADAATTRYTDRIKDGRL